MHTVVAPQRGLCCPHAIDGETEVLGKAFSRPTLLLSGRQDWNSTQCTLEGRAPFLGPTPLCSTSSCTQLSPLVQARVPQGPSMLLWPHLPVSPARPGLAPGCSPHPQASLSATHVCPNHLTPRAVMYSRLARPRAGPQELCGRVGKEGDLG